MNSSMIRLSTPFTHNRNRYLFANQKLNPHLSSFNFVPQCRKNYNSDAKEFDELAYEAERLRLDARARESMAQTSKTMTETTAEVEDDPRAWKWVIRKRVWDLMEAQNIAQNPRPVHHRIPNFVGASAAAKKLSELEAFVMAKCVKVNPDSPQKQVRFLTLSDGKKLLTPQPRLRTGFFSILESSMLTPSTINEACTSVGVAKYGRPIGLDEKIKVDGIVIGSGSRSKDGLDLARERDLPNLNMAYCGIWVRLMIQARWLPQASTGISCLLEKLGQIRILRELKSRIERETGNTLPCGPSERLPPTAQRRRRHS